MSKTRTIRFALTISGKQALVEFLSLEPLLGPLPNLDLRNIDWVIVGGKWGLGQDLSRKTGWLI